MNNKIIQLKLEPKIEELNIARNKIFSSIDDINESLRESCEIIIWELLENAMKYGESHFIKLEYAQYQSSIQIKVSNHISSSAKVSNVIKMIKTLQSTPDRNALYMKRLEEIFDRKDDLSQLGLYRIYAETSFDLDYDLTSNEITIIAIYLEDYKYLKITN